jgi:hypothetical protein
MHQLIYSVSPGLLALELYAFFRTLLKFLYFEMYTELLSVKKITFDDAITDMVLMML